MKKYINVGFMAIFTLMTFVLSFSSCSSEDDDIMSEYPPEEKPEVPHYDNLSYMPGANVQLINKAEYCKSIIADGKELITGNESGVITVPGLKDPKVYITFKEGITNFSDVFLGCTKLTSVPANLFANHPNATSFRSLPSLYSSDCHSGRFVCKQSSSRELCMAVLQLP